MLPNTHPSQVGHLSFKRNNELRSIWCQDLHPRYTVLPGFTWHRMFLPISVCSMMRSTLTPTPPPDMHRACALQGCAPYPSPAVSIVDQQDFLQYNFILLHTFPVYCYSLHPLALLPDLHFLPTGSVTDCDRYTWLPAVTIDSLKLTRCDAIKVNRGCCHHIDISRLQRHTPVAQMDVEGWENRALLGAIETISRFKA